MQKIWNYLRKNLLSLLIAAGVLFIAYCVFFPNANWSIGEIIVWLIFIVAGMYKERDNKLNEERLKKRGLTNAGLVNIDFVKNWDELRKKGPYKFCLVDGGIMTGMILLIPVSFAGFALTGFSMARNIRIFDEFGDMMRLIGGCFLVSYLMGCTIYFIRWSANERRFKTLTDPLSQR